MTLIYAHRGYSAKYPENTMFAFQKAEEAEADGIELDVQLTKDGEVVVIHDEKVNRTTNGKGYVKDLSYNELKRLDAGYQIKTIIKKQHIPSLKEVLEWMTTNKIICNIELKNNVFPYEGMEEKVIELVRKYGLQNRIIISSFNHYSIVHSYRIAPEIETAPLLGNAVYMPWVYAEAIKAKGIHPKYSAYRDDILKKTLDSGIAVRPYTVNNDKDIERLIRIGCTALITDNPVLALKLKKQA
ncbi:MAG: glycerophosphodiester phosphodiesterase [Bacillus sp. (in: firmicutes)]